MSTLEERVTALEATVAEHDDLLNQPQLAQEVARAEVASEVLDFGPGGPHEIEGLYFELDTADFAVELELYIAYLSSLATAATAIGLEIAIDDVGVQNTTVNVPVAIALGYGSQIIKLKVEEGSGIIEVKGRITVAGGSGTVYVADDDTTTSYIRALRV